MIEKKSVLILGAGASKPYGFPLGSELRDAVIGQAKEIRRVKSELDLGFESSDYQSFSKNLSHSGYSSVDAFLEENTEWDWVGKPAIALQLLASELHCEHKLFPPHQPSDHWYEKLWQHLKAPSWASFKKNKLSIITFNYDRSLEHYLTTVLCRNYGISCEVAFRGLKNLPFIHVHGDLGPYLTRKQEPDFGQLLEQSRYDRAKRGIRIVHEDRGNTGVFKRARTVISQAEKVFFVGFGYHPQNMAKLGFREQKSLSDSFPARIFGTHKGIPAKSWKNLCYRYGFPRSAISKGTGSISKCIDEWL